MAFFFLQQKKMLALYCVVWIAACFAAAYEHLPDFPIEISWTATASPASHALFVAGSALFGPVALYDGHSPLVLLPWACLMGVTGTEHTRFKHLHMHFVNGMVASALFVVMMQSPTWSGGLLRIGAYAAFYLLRAAAKVVAAAHVGLSPPLANYVEDPVGSFRDYIARMHSHHLERKASDDATKTVTRLGAVSQWISFALLGMLLTGAL